MQFSNNCFLLKNKVDENAFPHKHSLLELGYIICILMLQNKDKHPLHQIQLSSSLNHLCQKCENILTMKSMEWWPWRDSFCFPTINHNKVGCVILLAFIAQLQFPWITSWVLGYKESNTRPLVFSLSLFFYSQYLLSEFRFEEVNKGLPYIQRNGSSSAHAKKGVVSVQQTGCELSFERGTRCRWNAELEMGCS